MTCVTLWNGIGAWLREVKCKGINVFGESDNRCIGSIKFLRSPLRVYDLSIYADTRGSAFELSQVHSVAWNCLGKKLASGSVDQTARIWHIEPHGHVCVPDHIVST